MVAQLTGTKKKNAQRESDGGYYLSYHEIPTNGGEEKGGGYARLGFHRDLGGRQAQLSAQPPGTAIFKRIVRGKSSEDFGLILGFNARVVRGKTSELKQGRGKEKVEWCLLEEPASAGRKKNQGDECVLYSGTRKQEN